MAKQVKQATAAATATNGPVLGLVAGAKPNFRQGSARAAYYAVFAAHAGKPLATATAAIAATPPSMPKKGKLAGKPEPVAGWVNWFIRHGYLTLA